jgi:hypothetical protein
MIVQYVNIVVSSNTFTPMQLDQVLEINKHNILKKPQLWKASGRGTRRVNPPPLLLGSWRPCHPMFITLINIFLFQTLVWKYTSTFLILHTPLIPSWWCCLPPCVSSFICSRLDGETLAISWTEIKIMLSSFVLCAWSYYSNMFCECQTHNVFII